MSDGGRSFKKPKKNKGGRPLKLNEDLIEKVCEHLKHGAFVETAVACAGIPKATFYYWMKLANTKPKSIYKKLLDAVEKAQAEAEANDLLYITKARAKNWKASAWRLERRFPQRWAPTHRPPVQADVDPDDSTFTLAYNFDEDESE